MRATIASLCLFLFLLSTGCGGTTPFDPGPCCKVVLESQDEQIVELFYYDPRNVKIESGVYHEGRDYWEVVVKYDNYTRQNQMIKDGKALRVRDAVLTTTAFGPTFEDLQGQRWEIVQGDQRPPLPSELPQKMLSLEGEYIHTGKDVFFIQDTRSWKRLEPIVTN